MKQTMIVRLTLASAVAVAVAALRGNSVAKDNNKQTNENHQTPQI